MMYELTVAAAALALIGALAIALNPRVQEGLIVDAGIAVAATGAFGFVVRGLSQRDSYSADLFSAQLLFIGLALIALGVLLNLRPRPAWLLRKKDRRKGDRRRAETS